jgi:hypothetical protein
MATKNDLVIEQGTTFSTVINLVDEANNPIALAGYSAAAQMKRWYTSVTSTSFTTTINTIAGSVTLQLSPAVTMNLVHGRYVYDVDIIDAANNISRVVEGIVVVTPGVTNLTIETAPATYNPNTDFVAVPLDNYSNTV